MENFDWLKEIEELKKISYNQALRAVAREHHLDPVKLEEILNKKKNKIEEKSCRGKLSKNILLY